MSKKIIGLISMIFILAGCQNEEKIEINNGADNEKNDMSIIAIANSYDFGPAIDELILTLPEEVKANSLAENSFEVVSKREALEFDFDSELPEQKKREEKRKIKKIFLSDESGNKIEDQSGKRLTIQMTVSPDNPISIPFNMSVETMMSEKVPVEFIVTQNNPIKNSEGKDINGLTGKIDEKNQNQIIYPVSNNFSEMTKSNKEDSIQYTDFKPEDSGEKQPLIVWLHGIGEGGSDKDIALNGNKVGSFVTKEHQEIFNGAFVLIPQAKTFWLDNGSHSLETDSLVELTGKSIYTEELKKGIDDYVLNNPKIDTSRIYIGGCSNGGFMTVNMIANFPNYFAAGFPVCEPFPNEKLTEKQKDSLSNTPLWFVQAKTDPLVSAEMFSIPLVEELEKRGSKDVYLSLYDKVEDKTGEFMTEDGKTPYEYNGHFSWIDALNNNPTRDNDGQKITLFEWLANQKNRVGVQ